MFVKGFFTCLLLHTKYHVPVHTLTDPFESYQTYLARSLP